MDRAYDNYRVSHVEHIMSERALPTTLRQLRPLLPPKGGQLLELGCGSGELLSALRSDGFADAKGADSSTDQVREAQRRGVDVVQQDLLEFLQEGKADTDVIIAIDVLEHMSKEKLIDVLEAVYARLRPGGIFIARVPNPQCPFGGAIGFGDVTHQTLLAPLAMQQVLRLANLLPETLIAASPGRFGWRSSIRFVLWLAQQRIFRFMFEIESGAGTQTTFSLNYLVKASRPQ